MLSKKVIVFSVIAILLLVGVWWYYYPLGYGPLAPVNSCTASGNLFCDEAVFQRTNTGLTMEFVVHDKNGNELQTANPPAGFSTAKPISTVICQSTQVNDSRTAHIVCTVAGDFGKKATFRGTVFTLQGNSEIIITANEIRSQS